MQPCTFPLAVIQLPHSAVSKKPRGMATSLFTFFATLKFFPEIGSLASSVAPVTPEESEEVQQPCLLV